MLSTERKVAILINSLYARQRNLAAQHIGMGNERRELEGSAMALGSNVVVTCVVARLLRAHEYLRGESWPRRSQVYLRRRASSASSWSRLE